jgi:rod shape-determining protein MreD
MKFCFTTFLIFLTPICQYTILPLFPFQYFTPDLFLIMTIYFSIITQCYEKSYLFGLGLGLLQDLVGGGITGTYTLSKGLLGLLSRIIARKFLRVNLFTQIFFFFLGSFIDSILLVWTTSYLLEKNLAQHIFLRTLSTKFTLNTFLGIPLILCLIKVEETLKIRKRIGSIIPALERGTPNAS